MKFLPQSVIVAALLAGVFSIPAAAQAPEERIIITFTPAVATIGGDTELALAGTVGYRFTDHLSFEGEFTWIDAAAGGDRDRVLPLGSAQLTTGITEIVSRTTARFGAINPRNFPGIPDIPIPIEGFGESDGQTMIATLGVRYEPSVQTARFRPYLSGGLGLNHTEQELTLRIATVAPTFDESISHAGFAFSAGGGANVRLFSSLWAGADAKYFRLSQDRNIIRFGGSIGFRF